MIPSPPLHLRSRTALRPGFVRVKVMGWMMMVIVILSTYYGIPASQAFLQHEWSLNACYSGRTQSLRQAEAAAAKTFIHSVLQMTKTDYSPFTLLSNFSIHWCPSILQVDHVSHQYKDTLWRRLTSSVPRREFALQNVSCTLFAEEQEQQQSSSENIDDDVDDHDDMACLTTRSLVLLVGASSSGKSALLKLMRQQELPSHGGTVKITSRFITDGVSSADALKARPILLEPGEMIMTTTTTAMDPPRSTTVVAYLNSVLQKLLPVSSEKWKDSTFHQTILLEVSACLDLSLEERLSALTPSEQYRLTLARALLESSLSNMMESHAPPLYQENGHWHLPGPILLLDEWLDKETSAVTAKVVAALQKVVHSCGGIVVSATHKQDLYRTVPTTKIRLSAGKVLDVEHAKKLQ